LTASAAVFPLIVKRSPTGTGVWETTLCQPADDFWHRARAFLFPSKIRNEYIEELFDARVLHLLKKNVSSNDRPGERFDVFKIDYGCYVDLKNTNREPLGLFETDDGYVEVPRDDYRSIRRAILQPEMLTQSNSNDAS
jgi:hypothetical protein